MNISCIKSFNSSSSMDDSRKYIDDHYHHNFPKFNPKIEIGTQYFTNLMKNYLLLATEKLLIAKKLGFSDHFDPQNDHHQIKGKKIPSKKYPLTYNPSPSSSSDHVQNHNHFPLNFISFFIMLSIKIVTFQISSFVSFVTFPISFLNFSIMLVFFPFQTLSRVKDHTKQKLLKSCNALCFGLTSFICNRFKSQKPMLKIAVRSTKALLCSVYVFFLLASLLVSGFVLSGILMRKLVEESVHTTQPLNFDYTKTSPVAFVGFGPVGSGRRAVPCHHKLRVTVSLTLPESEYNTKLGIFQVRVESLSNTGDRIQESSHPTMLRFKSQQLRLIHTFLNALPLIAGFESEIQTLKIAMGEFREGDIPTASFKVILEQRAELKSGSGVPEIYGGSVEIASELPRLKRMVSIWRRTVLVWIGFSIFVFQVLVMLIFCRPVVFRSGVLVGKKKSSSWPDRIAWYKL